jgi:hypothetical protein
MKRKYWLLVLVIAVLLNGSQVLADGDFYVVGGGGGVGTKITNLPKTIDTPGFYYLSENLTYSGIANAITINADNVTLDLMGFRLANGGASGNTHGIHMSGRSNVEIRNGTLSGWWIGIFENGSSLTGHRIINVRVDASGNGFWLSGDALVRGCTVTAPADNTGYQGIFVSGNGIVSGCTVKNFSKSSPTSYGIKLGQSGICSGNVIINCYVGLHVNKSGSIIGNTVITNSSQYGIYLYGVADDYVMLDQNTVMGPGARFYNAANGVSYLKGTNAGF